jgi:hypothetical protein
LIGPYQDVERHRVVQTFGASVASTPKKKRTDAIMRQISVDEVFDASVAMLHAPAQPARDRNH